MIVIIYSTAVCPKCQRLKAFLLKNDIKYLSQDMGAPENLTELIFNGIFTRAAPVLRAGSSFLTSESMFHGTELQEENVLNFLSKT